MNMKRDEPSRAARDQAAHLWGPRRMTGVWLQDVAVAITCLLYLVGQAFAQAPQEAYPPPFGLDPPGHAREPALSLASPLHVVDAQERDALTLPAQPSHILEISSQTLSLAETTSPSAVSVDAGKTHSNDLHLSDDAPRAGVLSEEQVWPEATSAAMAELQIGGASASGRSAPAALGQEKSAGMPKESQDLEVDLEDIVGGHVRSLAAEKQSRLVGTPQEEDLAQRGGGALTESFETEAMPDVYGKQTSRSNVTSTPLCGEFNNGASLFDPASNNRCSFVCVYSRINPRQALRYCCPEGLCFRILPTAANQTGTCGVRDLSPGPAIWETLTWCLVAAH